MAPTKKMKKIKFNSKTQIQTCCCWFRELGSCLCLVCTAAFRSSCKSNQEHRLLITQFKKEEKKRVFQTCCTLTRILRISSSCSFNPRPYIRHWNVVRKVINFDLRRNNPVLLGRMTIEQVIELVQLGQVPVEVVGEGDDVAGPGVQDQRVKVDWPEPEKLGDAIKSRRCGNGQGLSLK